MEAELEAGAMVEGGAELMRDASARERTGAPLDAPLDLARSMAESLATGSLMEIATGGLTQLFGEEAEKVEARRRAKAEREAADDEAARRSAVVQAAALRALLAEREAASVLAAQKIEEQARVAAEVAKATSLAAQQTVQVAFVAEQDARAAAKAAEAEYERFVSETKEVTVSNGASRVSAEADGYQGRTVASVGEPAGAGGAGAEGFAARSSPTGTLTDEELRARRDEAQATLRRQRPRSLSESLSTAALDAALAATASAAGGADGGGSATPLAAWAAEQREQLRTEAEAAEKAKRLSLFASDFELLGLAVDKAAELDEKTLRKAFRDRSRVLHPDVRASMSTSTTGADGARGESENEDEYLPSVYELNAAYENLRKLL